MVDADDGPAGIVDRRSMLKLAGVVLTSAMDGVANMTGAAARPFDIVTMNAVALSAAIRARRVSCAEVMQAYLAQIDRFNPKVNAIVALQDREDLLRQARGRDDQLAHGEWMGPLHGFPHAAKDLQPVKGLPFTQGSPIFKDTVASFDSIMVERLRASGAIFIGKTNTPEFGLGSHTFNPVWGLTRNPYDPSKSAGGSSGGAAVALALDMLPLADGSDFGGSLRNPAGWNNVFGFRTSYGRVPVHVREDWLPGMGVTGPMARTVADLAMLLSIQAGYDPRAPLSMESGGEVFAGSLAGEAKGRRIAWLGDLGGAIPYDPGVLEVCRGALKAFETIGCLVEDAHPDYPVEAVWQAFIRLRAWQTGANLQGFYDDPAHRPLLKAEAVFEIETGAKLSGYDVTAASIVRSEWSQAVRRLFDHYDFLVMPTAQVFPFDAQQSWPSEVAGRAMRTYHEWMQGVCLVTMSGCPALAAPVGFSRQGLPIGIQIVAPVHRELDCLKLAHAYEQAADLAKTRPPMLARG
jgi:amidase